jgi:hypothetical protein
MRSRFNIPPPNPAGNFAGQDTASKIGPPPSLAKIPPPNSADTFGIQDGLAFRRLFRAI